MSNSEKTFDTRWISMPVMAVLVLMNGSISIDVVIFILFSSFPIKIYL